MPCERARNMENTLEKTEGMDEKAKKKKNKTAI